MNDKTQEPSPSKGILTKEEFLQVNAAAAREMSADQDLQHRALEVFVKADSHRWLHQMTWFGEPLLNLPQDMFALQEIVWRTKPDFIIELGVAWGGALLFEATLLDMIGGRKTIGIDIFVPPDLRKRLSSHTRLSERIELIQASSTSAETLERVTQLLDGSRNVLAILDSNHSHDHVLAELRAYAGFVGEGQYMLCGDTIIESIPTQSHGPRPWGPGNSPATALKQFLAETDRFVVDRTIDQRLLFSCNPGGYLRAIK